MSSKINIKQIFEKHKETLKSPYTKHSRNGITYPRKIKLSDRLIFYVLPAIIAILFVFILGIPNSDAISIYGICLSIFVGLFLNMIVLVITFLKPSVNVVKKKTRTSLVKEIFYNISYTIVISLLGLACLFISTQTFLPEKVTLSLCDKIVSFNTIINYAASGLLYYYLSKVTLTLLMILKRIFILFKVDIENYENELNK